MNRLDPTTCFQATCHLIIWGSHEQLESKEKPPRLKSCHSSLSKKVIMVIKVHPYKGKDIQTWIAAEIGDNKAGGTG